MAAVLQSMEKATNETEGEPNNDVSENKIDDQEPDNGDMDPHLKEKLAIINAIYEPPHGKTNILHRRKQRCRSASR